MALEIKIPSPGESITEVEIAKWLVEDGAMVEKNQEVAEIESDKATFSLSASEKGRIKILLKEGARVAVGTIACTIDAENGKTVSEKSEGINIEEGKPEVEVSPEDKGVTEQPAAEKIKPAEGKKSEETKIEEAPSENEIEKEEVFASEKAEQQAEEVQREETTAGEIVSEDNSKVKFTAAARAVMKAEGLSVDEVLEGIHRLSRQDVESAVKAIKQTASEKKEGETTLGTPSPSRKENRFQMSPLRRKLSQRLVAVKNETAMLTTFNEIDMQQLIQLRTKHQKAFTEKHGIKLGYMSFFTKAVSIALSSYPMVNSMIDGEEIMTPDYQDIGIAVQTEKGLMVPIIRDAVTMNIAEVEHEIFELAEKARNKKLSIQEMTGGTFSITNGGLFGSLMSTPIINPPQSAILGLHAIKDRPVAIENKVEIRPMMYVALTYDHRLIDGKISVSFLVKIKDLIENPFSLLFNGKNPEILLLGLE